VINFNKIWVWLKKYSVWIAIVQALLWAPTMAYEQYWNSRWVKMHPETAVIYDTLREWHMLANTPPFRPCRSRDACEYIKENTPEDHPIQNYNCKLFSYESDNLLDKMEEYGIDRYSESVPGILKVLYFSNKGMSPSVRKEFGEIIED
jgi:hypothetical protein